MRKQKGKNEPELGYYDIDTNMFEMHKNNDRAPDFAKTISRDKVCKLFNTDKETVKGDYADAHLIKRRTVSAF